MASHTNRLTALGKEGFAQVDRWNRGGTRVQALKSQYSGPQQYAPVPNDENVIDSQEAAERYNGVVITEYGNKKKKKFSSWRFKVLAL